MLIQDYKIKTEYRIVKIGIYHFLKYLIRYEFVLVKLIRWKFIPYYDNPSGSQLRHNKYVSDNNSDISKFINHYPYINKYFKSDYTILKEQSIKEYNEFKQQIITLI